MRSRFLRVLAACVLASCSMSGAQGDPRSLTGTVTDHQHEPLKGAVVQVQNESTNAVVSFITDANGTFFFRRLGGDETDFLVWATYRGHRSKSKELSHFESNRHPDVKIVVELD